VEAVGHLKGAEFRVRLNDMRLPPLDGLDDGEWLVDAPAETLGRRGLPGEPAVHPYSHVRCSRLRGNEELLQRCRDVGNTIGPAAFVVASMRAVARGHAAHLLTSEAVDCLLDLQCDTTPALVGATRARFHPTMLTWLFRDLLDDHVPVRDLQTLLEELLAGEGTHASAPSLDALRTKDIGAWSDVARQAVRRHIVQRYADAGELSVHLLAPDLEARIARRDVHLFEDDGRERLIESLLRAEAALHPRPLVVLTTREVGRILRRTIALELPRVVVLSHQELVPDVNVGSLGRISLGVDAG
jgi:flagellar biosynthesis protein FlhA